MVQASGTQGGFAPVASSSALSQQPLTLPPPQNLPLAGSVPLPLKEVLHSSQSSDLTTSIVNSALDVSRTRVDSNINISRLAGNQSEGAISINPTNPLNMVAISNLDRGRGLFKAYSTNGGTTWISQTIATSTANPLGAACCDPSLAFDSFGNLFLTYLTDFGTGLQVEVALSKDGGVTFSPLATLGIAGDVDQPSITTGANSVWVTYNESESISAAGAAVTGLGAIESFSTPQVAPGSEGGSFGDVAIAPNGQVMVTYQDNTGANTGSSNIFVNVDPDGLGPHGFGNAIKATSTNVTGFDYIPAQSSRSVDAEAGLAWDRSSTPRKGRVYLVYTDETPDESNNTDIYVRYSDNSGTTWSNPVRVNDDMGKNSQFLPRIAVDQTTGNIAVSWHDARNDQGVGSVGSTNSIPNDDAQLYASVSYDGGLSFQPNIKVSKGTSNAAKSPDPEPGFARLDYGDYTGLAFYGSNFYPIWADNSNSTRDNPQGALSGFDLYTAKVAVSPPNDNFASSAVLTGATANTTGTNINATIEPGEPNIAGILGGKSVWWSWTAPFTGTTTINTFGSNFDTVLGVFTGSSFTNLRPVAANDDANGTTQSQVTFDAVAGATYRIVVDGLTGASGKVSLALIESPPNDNFARSAVLKGATVKTSGANFNATTESGEPNIVRIPGGHSVWWSWTAPFTGAATINTLGSNFDTTLGVLTGSSVSGLTAVAANDDANGTVQSQVRFNAVGGTTYRIWVDGAFGATGTILLAISEGLVASQTLATSSSYYYDRPTQSISLPSGKLTSAIGEEADPITDPWGLCIG